MRIGGWATGAGYLFQGKELREQLAELRHQLTAEVQGADETYLLNTDEDEWVAHLVEHYTVEVPTLRPDDRYAEDLGERQVDVSHDHFQRAILDPSTPTYIAGRALRVHIPFDGDAWFFQLQASTYSLNPPHAEVRGNELVLDFEFPADRRPPIDGAVQELTNKVEQHLGWQCGDVATYNAQLEQDARNAISARRERVLADHEFLDNLGIPVKKRDDAPTTYAAPGITRRPAPSPPKPTKKSEAPKALEPTLVGEFYDHICQVTRAMGHSMERAPEAYASWEEERLRDNLVVMLNSHYEGQATGETFNRSGKTDILVRVEDRNVFIGECKWWSGAAGFIKATDQLFSYSTWRDTKLALVVFVRAKGLTDIIAKAKQALEEHEQFLGWEQAQDETELRARMSWPGDPERQATLTVFFFHLAETS